MAHTAPQSGALIDGRYLLGEQLGRGATSVVFEATDQVSGQHVALKLMRSDLQRPSLVERFARESALAAKVTHPGVVRTLASGWVSGVPYVVLERLKGQDAP